MFENVNCNRSDFIKFSTKLSMSTKLKYLLFYDVNCLDEDIFGTIWKLCVPNLESFYLKFSTSKEELNSEFEFQEPLQKLLAYNPKLKSVQLYSRSFLDISSKFLLQISKENGLYINFGNANLKKSNLTEFDIANIAQISMEKYFKEHDQSIWKKYQKLKEIFLQWWRKWLVVQLWKNLTVFANKWDFSLTIIRLNFPPNFFKTLILSFSPRNKHILWRFLCKNSLALAKNLTVTLPFLFVLKNDRKSALLDLSFVNKARAFSVFPSFWVKVWRKNKRRFWRKLTQD